MAEQIIYYIKSVKSKTTKKNTFAFYELLMNK